MESSSLENQVQVCITDSWKDISVKLKNYSDIVSVGEKHISSFIAHKTTLKNVSKPDEKFKETELYKMDPDILLKLKFNIRREMSSEQTAVGKVLKDLQSLYNMIIGKLDKISSAYQTSNLSNEDLLKASICSLSTAEMLELVDRFKSSFINSHDGLKYSLESLLFTDDNEKVLSLWDISEIMSLKEELDLKLL